ncbi:conserved hypothetical protein [Mycolicibacter sinensis]|uniref:DUF5642 domain-containing protein n=1 Tax=Mycolicibacter sinensis (strain JDM601) TaxID=875328 RepID=F5YWV0_MYCSD|nr:MULTISPECIES: DUF5642 family protein [Mycobacteriaceae]AEF36554.1 conserved hypothetical protein [Mycolicibacter sinensis]
MASLVVVVTAKSAAPNADGGRRGSARHGVALMTVLGVAAILAGCDRSVESAPAGSAAPRPAAAQSTQDAAAYDISRVDAVKDDFPEGFTAQAHPAKTLGQQDIAGSGVVAFTDAQFDPPQCRSVVIPPYVDPTVGTEAAGVIGQGDQGNMYVVAMRSPKPVATADDPVGCDRISLSGSPQATGTVERIPAPAIPGVSTTGVKLTVADPEEDPDYLYTAALNDRTSIVVMGSADQQLDPQRLMSDLLVKAVAAVRGQ